MTPNKLHATTTSKQPASQSIDQTEVKPTEILLFKSRQIVQILTVLLLLLALGTATGCELFGLVANAFFPKKIKAQYRLPDQPTLVLVDDPKMLFDNPALPTQIASHTGFYLTEAAVLDQNHLISQQNLNKFSSRLGKQFDSTPIDMIGKRLGASQVIHINVKMLTIDRHPGLSRSSATVQVKVIDALQGNRLYPYESNAPDNSSKTIKVTIPYRTHQNEANIERILEQKLAERIGRNVAKLFYDHLPRQPGEPFDG